MNQPATAAFAACEAFIHSRSHGARTLDVIRQSATKVPLGDTDEAARKTPSYRAPGQ